MTVRQSHELAHKVRLHVMQTLDWVADVLVHVEPAGKAGRVWVPCECRFGVVRIRSECRSLFVTIRLALANGTRSSAGSSRSSVRTGRTAVNRLRDCYQSYE
jgi:hypothetical protein